MACEKIVAPLFWEEVDTVLLDMDGTVLDKHFDDYFWEQYLPEHYSLLHDISVEAAREQLLARYRQVQDTLAWADIDFWSGELGLDLRELKLRIDHLIAIHPHAFEFLNFCLQSNKRLHLVTNAHASTLAIKLDRTNIGPWFERIVCAHDVGLAKEEQGFWERLERLVPFDKSRTLLVDDTEQVLRAARDYGLAHLRLIAKPNSRRSSRYSCQFPAIDTFQELLPY